MNNAKRVLICNRGEIAIRIAKALKELGHIPIGVYTDSEPQAYHLEFCLEWIKLEGKDNRETYLNTDQILKICMQHKVDAIHPGYGFLSENSSFARKVIQNKIIFIGPNPDAIDAMGDKAKSKKLAQSAGVPVVPGSLGEVASKKEALDIATQIGFPILLKAVAGGGGKGMRICNKPADIDLNFDAVEREALSSFGYAGIIVEKYVLNPHHIEVQILADKKGNVYHLFERECSVQRRHQKIIEEAPSPFIGEDATLRESICKAAVKLAQAVKYDSAGTVEFVMGEDKKFYFLEMNTRIQVEHPITEEITGIDLVVNMIKSAFDMPLDFNQQADITIKGHSIECRICAENPVTMLPAPGTIQSFDFVLPQGARFDHCIYPGFEVKPDFDPMIGKLITRGITRGVALRKMRAALSSLQIEGMLTNTSLLMLICQEDDFCRGIYCTNYLQIKANIIKDLTHSKINTKNPTHLRKIASLVASQIETLR